MKYTYILKPALSAKSINKKQAFIDIVEGCNELNDYDNLIVYKFGRKGDLVLDILKDSKYIPEKNSTEIGVVTVTTYQRQKGRAMKRVDDIECVCISDGSFYKELKRIWDYHNLYTSCKKGYEYMP